MPSAYYSVQSHQSKNWRLWVLCKNRLWKNHSGIFSPKFHSKPPVYSNGMHIAFIFRTGGLRTSFYQLNCDPLEFGLYTLPWNFPNLASKGLNGFNRRPSPGFWSLNTSPPGFVRSFSPTPWIFQGLFYPLPPWFSSVLNPPVRIINAICIMQKMTEISSRFAQKYISLWSWT